MSGEVESGEVMSRGILTMGIVKERERGGGERFR